LLNDAGALPDKHAAAPREVIRAFGSVPDFSSFHNIHYIVMLAPCVRKAVLERTIKYTDQRISAAELPVITGVCFYFGKEVEHDVCTAKVFKYVIQESLWLRA
jgi:hypothetical protein